MKNTLFYTLFFLSVLIVIAGCSNPVNRGPGPSGDKTIQYDPALKEAFFVKPNGDDTKDGSSWENAYADLQKAIDAAASAAAGESKQKYVLILGGSTYYPAPGGGH